MFESLKFRFHRWSRPRSPQSLADREAHLRPTRNSVALFGRWTGPTGFFTGLDTVGHVWDGRPHFVARPAYEHLQNSPGWLPEKQRAGDGVRFPSFACRLWPGKASGERSIQRFLEPQGFTGSQEQSGSLQAGGEAVVKGASQTCSSHLVFSGSVLKEEDGVLQNLCLLHPALNLFL